MAIPPGPVSRDSQILVCAFGGKQWLANQRRRTGALPGPACTVALLRRLSLGGGWHCQLPFTRRLPDSPLHLAWSPLPVRNLAAVEELLINVLAASLAYLLERLVLRVIRHLLPVPAQ
jgi:hypothetical protein